VEGLSDAEECDFGLKNKTALERIVANFISPNTDVFVAAPAASIDFIIFSDKTSIGSLPNSIRCAGHTIFLGFPRDDCDLELDDQAHGDILNTCQVVPDSNTIVVEVDTNKSVAVLATKQRKASLVTSTVQCFGYRSSDHCRCENRRRSTNAHIWCHHHSSQELEFNSKVMHHTAPIPSWWCDDCCK
jgi:hypothetical protein